MFYNDSEYPDHNATNINAARFAISVKIIVHATSVHFQAMMIRRKRNPNTANDMSASRGKDVIAMLYLCELNRCCQKS